MENNNINTQVVELEKVPATATHALITNVELSNGKTTQVVTFFNIKDVGFEEVNIGVSNALSMQKHVTSMQSDLTVMKNGKPKLEAHFEKKIFTNENRYSTTQ